MCCKVAKTEDYNQSNACCIVAITKDYNKSNACCIVAITKDYNQALHNAWTLIVELGKITRRP